MSIATKVLVMDLYAVQDAIPARKHKTQNKTHHTKTKRPNKSTRKWDRYRQWRYMHDDILCVMMTLALNKKQNRETRQKHKKQQSSMQKPGILPARIPEITKSSRPGMIFTLTLRSKHRQRRVATKVVRRERMVKQEGETWSSVKMTAKLRHSGRTQSPLTSSFPSISIMGAAVCGKFQCTSALASIPHGM